MNAARYVLRSGCAWRNLPHDFPAWQSAYYHFNKWRDTGLWKALNKHLRRCLREKLRRDAYASVGLVDSQSVKGSIHKGNGYDGYKASNGRKRHILVDTLGSMVRMKSYSNMQVEEKRRQGRHIFIA